MFVKRTTKPSKNKHYIRIASGGWNSCIKGYPLDKDADVLANCVGYANGRFNEIISDITGFEGNKYNTLNCNAENFIERAEKAGLEIGQVPKPGAIMCWEGIDENIETGKAARAGHVAVIEEVYDNNNVYTSESNYGGVAFYNVKRNNTNGRWGLSSKYRFRGFIYNPAVKEEKPVKLKVGDIVYINGVYVSSDSDEKLKPAITKGKITKILKGARNPYLLNNGDIGWVNDECIVKEEPVRYLNLAPTVSSWAVYKTSKYYNPDKKSDILLKLNPKKYNGLSYKILEDMGDYHFKINTANKGEGYIAGNPYKYPCTITEKPIYKEGNN